jgi:Tfp pilus assembly protein PilZ
VRNSTEASSLQTGRSSLRVAFATLEEFRQEYKDNLVRGGLFVPTGDELGVREEVEVELDLEFRGASFQLMGEVVSVVPAGLATHGGTPGVALQLSADSEELRHTFEPVVGVIPDPDPGHQVGERRVAPRRPTRVMGKMSGADGATAVRTRDVSRTGVLVSLEGIPQTPVGGEVQLVLTHPITSQELEVSGIVVRHIEGEGGVPALAVAFSEDDAARPEVVRFMDDLQSVGHARELASITGPIEEMGLANLLQGFAQAATAGTLTVTRGNEEGRVVFEGGRLLAARAGAATGVKALARLLAWESGSFDFHAHVEGEERDEPLPIEIALIDAARQVDEMRRLIPLPVDLADTLSVAKSAAASADPAPDKTESAILDLAVADFTVRAMLDVIPEEDHIVLRAITSLLDRGILVGSD